MDQQWDIDIGGSAIREMARERDEERAMVYAAVDSCLSQNFEHVPKNDGPVPGMRQPVQDTGDAPVRRVRGPAPTG